MSVKKENAEDKKYLNAYEHNAMCMSYRYAIGRHTALSVMHAGDLVQNVYGRIHPDHLHYDVYDMRREINQALEYEFNFGLEYVYLHDSFDPFNALIQLEKKIKKDSDINLLAYLKNHKITAKLNDKFEYEFDEKMPNYPGVEKYEVKLLDLLAWANAANALDPNKHHMVTTKYSGEEKTYEAFEYITYNKINGFHINYTAIDNYLKNPHEFTYISEEFIIKIDGKEYEFGTTK